MRFRSFFSIMLTALALPATLLGDVDCADVQVATVACHAEAPCGDEVLLVDTRSLPDCTSDAVRARRISVRRLEDGCWRSADLLAVAAEGEPRQTVVWVHGNRFSAEDAREYGLRCYRNFSRWRSSDLPLRFVIWSWPSDRITGPLRDAREKAHRANAEGTNVAWAMRQLRPTNPWGLIGYSYGGRVSTSALNELGRSNAGDSLGPARVVLFAPALNNDWLLPGRRHGAALQQVERLVVLYNPRDMVLKRYRLLDPFTKPRALGYTGIASLARLGPWRDRYAQMSVDGILGRGHGVAEYLDRAWVMRFAARTISPSHVESSDVDEELEVEELEIDAEEPIPVETLPVPVLDEEAWDAPVLDDPAPALDGEAA